MRRNTLTALAIAAIGAITMPAAVAAQTAPAPHHERGAMAMRGGSFVEHIIEKRAELDLADAQVTQLRAIAARLEEQNQPLIAQLQSAREKMRAERTPITEEQRTQMRERRQAMADSLRQLSPEQRAQMRQRRADGDPAQPRRMRMPELPDELKSVMEQVRTNTETAMQQVRSTLTPEQQDKLRELRPAMRHERTRGDRPGAARRMQGARAPRRAS